MTSLVLCDDHALILGGLRTLIADEADFSIVATAEDGIEALDVIHRHKPDIALVDISMPRIDGIALLQRIDREGWPIKVVLLSASISDSQILEAIAAGVAGIVLKDEAPATLVQCLRTVARGGRWLPPHLVVPAINRGRARDVTPLAALTPRERQVAALVAKGKANREVAAALSITEGTVKIHLHTIYSKLEVDNRTAFAIMFARWSEDRPAQAQ
ncbi:DNA-binding response regulator [Sphingomonas koreensis]|nr:DNA-binding response regulator [Sphingomonas koreensis]